MEAKFICILLALLVFHYENSAIVDCAVEELDALPDYFKIESYEVHIYNEVDASNPYYWGHVIIKVFCTKTTYDILLHGAEFNLEESDIEISSVTNNAESIPLNIEELNFLSSKRLQIVTTTIIVEGETYKIKIKFFKQFAKDSTGYIFQTDTRFEGAASKFFTYTDIKEFGARYVIPCFDQMNIKAKFKMSISSPRGFKAFSNAQSKPKIVSTTGRPDWDTYVFEETERMAPFSMAIAVVKYFESEESQLADNVVVQTLARELLIQEIGPLNDIVSQIVTFFSSFFESPHPLKKLDVIVLPGVDFEIRHSFGVIFLSETYILNSMNQPTPHAQLNMVAKLCYAVSYQWIGYTVTMSDWIQNWWHHGLNHFLRTKCIREIHKEFEKSYLELTEIELFLNFLRSEETAEEYKPIQLLETYPEFRPLTYLTEEKANYFVQMIHFIHGSDLFSKTLATYVDKFKFQNSDLNQALNIFNDIPAEEMQPPPIDFMDIKNSWMTKKGAINPLIYVTKNRRTKKMILSQQVFNSLKLDEEKPTETHCWPVPLSYHTKHEQLPEKITPRLWVPCDTSVESVSINDGKDWVVYNLDLNVPGRVMYEQKHWKEIIWSLQHEEEYMLFRFPTRIRLISDMFALAEGGILLYEMVFDAMMYLNHEPEYACWSVAMKEFDRIRSRLLGTSLFPAYLEFMRGFLEPIFEKRKFHNLMNHSPRNHLESLFEALILEFSCKFGVVACEKESLRLHTETGRDRKMGITSTKLLQQSIKIHRTISIINRKRILQSVASGEKGYKVMKKFFLNNYATIQSSNAYGDTSHLFYMGILLDATNRKEDFTELKNFATKMQIDSWKEALQKNIRNAKKNYLWYNRSRESMKRIMDKYNKKYRQAEQNKHKSSRIMRTDERKF